MKILWIDLNSSYAHSSVALPAIHAQMPTDSDIEWDIVSCTINENIGTTVQKIYEHRPDILAGTLWLFNHEVMLHLCSRLKSLMPSVIIALGGPEFLGDNMDFLKKNPFISCVFRGEGEESVPQWLKSAEDQSGWAEVPGICYLTGDGVYIDNGKAMVQDFAGLKSPESSRFFNWTKPFVQLETTRGCFNTCAFCVSGGEKPVRTISVAAIRQRIEDIYNHGIRNIRVLDRTFNYDTKRAKEIFEVFMGFPEIQYHLEIHPALMSDELKKELESLPKGLLHLEAGIQSLREEVLDTAMRKGKLAAALEGLEFLCSLDNMETHADLIAGLPKYELGHIFEDIRTLASFSAGEIQLESLKLLPGTVMRANASELGIVYSPYPPYEVLQTNSISTIELQTSRQLSRLLDAFYNTPVWQDLTRRLIISDENFLYDFLVYLQKGDLIDFPMSLEKRGLLLYRYCSEFKRDFVDDATCAWIEAAMSFKKEPAVMVQHKRFELPSSWNVIYGEYSEDLRLCYFKGVNGRSYWFGYEPNKQNPKPAFRAEV